MRYLSWYPVLSSTKLTRLVLVLLVWYLCEISAFRSSWPHRRSIFFRNNNIMASFQSSASPSKDEPVVSDSLLRQVNAWCGLHGLMYTDGNISWTPAPIALSPTPYPASAFAFVHRLQPIWNVLVDRIARDRDFLVSELASVSHADAFTQRVLELYQLLPEDHIQHSWQLGILRSDYMLDYYKDAADGQEKVRPLQVEINTISSSFGSLSQKINRFHAFLLERQAEDPQYQALCQVVHTPFPAQNLRNLVEAHESHASLRRIARGLAIAHQKYLETERGASSEASNVRVLFIVQPGERNQADQRALEEELWVEHKIAAEFATMTELHEFLARAKTSHSEVGSLSRPRLFMQRSTGVPAVEISVAYYRAGYTPLDYLSENEWSVRSIIEFSAAVKCPSAGYHLAGAKAIQAALCKPGVLERFILHPATVSSSTLDAARGTAARSVGNDAHARLTAESMKLLRTCFAAQFALGDRSVAEAARGAIAACLAEGGHQWVLKPQREGGGNNFYHQELCSFLQAHQDDAAVLDGYVLMQRIFPKTQQTAFYRQGKVVLGSSISELGVYGIFLGNGNTDTAGVCLNEYAGYLLRTKAEGVDEGGVATGYSVLNSIYLVDE